MHRPSSGIWDPPITRQSYIMPAGRCTGTLWNLTERVLCDRLHQSSVCLYAPVAIRSRSYTGDGFVLLSAANSDVVTSAESSRVHTKAHRTVLACPNSGSLSPAAENTSHAGSSYRNFEHGVLRMLFLCSFVSPPNLFSNKVMAMLNICSLFLSSNDASRPFTDLSITRINQGSTIEWVILHTSRRYIREFWVGNASLVIILMHLDNQRLINEKV